MHLEGPWLSTTGKKKGKKKFASAEHARKARALEESWKELLKRQGVEQEERKQTRGLSAPSLSSSYSLKIPEGRNTTAHIKSVDTGGNAVLKPSPRVAKGTQVMRLCVQWRQLHESRVLSEPREVNSLYVM